MTTATIPTIFTAVSGIARTAARFVVVGPPIGVFVPVLPAYYTTVWVGGYPYYYANDTYYTWDPQQGSTRWSRRRVGRYGEHRAAARANGELYSYPKNGQAPEQQEQDRYECHRWAVEPVGLRSDAERVRRPPPPDPGKRPAYQHAMTACLEGRGYTVK